MTLFATRGPPTYCFQAIPPLRCQRKRPRTIPSPLLQFLPRHLSLRQNRRRAQQPPSPGEPPPSRGPYSCIQRPCPLREPLPLCSRSPFLSVPVAAPPSPFPPPSPHTFLRYVPLGSVLIVPSPCFCDSCSCCSSFCLCNFS